MKQIQIRFISLISEKKFEAKRAHPNPGCSSRIPDPDADFLPIPDPGPRGQKAPDPGSRIRIRNTVFNTASSASSSDSTVSEDAEMRSNPGLL